MTRDEQRDECIDAMAKAECALSGEIWEDTDEAARDDYRMNAQPLFDSLHDIVRVNPIEATEEMLMHARINSNTSPENLYRVMSAVGDLTNQPEMKP